ncbi:glycoside hydrolase [Altererythrobacter buctensis]|uniref:Glycoside hydrolase n=2 Tax=Alteraurantiacibacter buctensis TaxID=1503981 RepID=A0A844YUA3_9SPHN|nr:glycoside hydrolase [Alteraurantiacibacter buctensis]
MHKGPLLAFVSALALAGCATAQVQTVAPPPMVAAVDPLAAGFAAPPAEARPRVWWHWMHGNVTQEGIAADLAWMDRVGIGGFQNFDANLDTPQVVERPLRYMTPEWREAFRFAASEAARLDLEMAIASSPGWSHTGGPWVPVEDGIKKLVWGETRLVGGQRFADAINAAPTVTGTYQAMALQPDVIHGDTGHAPPQAAGRIAVLAVPVSEPTLPQPRYSLPDGTAIDGAGLADASLESGFALPLSQDRQGGLTITYPQPVTVRTLHIALPGLVRPFRDPPVSPSLEARIGGQWQHVADLPLTNTPATHTFDPVTAAEFRLVIRNNTSAVAPTEMDGVPGAIVVDIFALGDLSTVPLNDLRLSGAHRVGRAQEKAGFAGIYDYYPIMSDDATPVDLTTAQVIDLTDRIAPDGTLDWTPPAGSDWLVLDFGWSLTGKTNHPAPPEATGLEVDKYDPDAVRRYFDTYLGMYRETVGDDLIGARGVTALLTDSIEAGYANWTPAMEREFAARRGYALRPWMPALAGIVIGSEAETERFLYDWRLTLSDLLTDSLYRVAAEAADANGLTLYGEALEDKRPMLGDDLSMRRYADIPMAALWTYPRSGQVRTTLLGDMKGAASTAHVYGQRFVAAESMTAASSPWAFAPRDLRRFIDLEFAYGINRPVIHTSVHQPSDDLQPGLSLAIFGQYFNRHETWAEMAGPWVDYMARNAWMLSQGQYFADIALFRGEESPVTAQFATSIPAGLPSRYAYDFVNAEMLADAFRVEQGQLVSQGGTRYRVLALRPDARNMTLPTLRRIAQLVEQGATVVGRKPLSTPSLADDAAEFATLADRLWQNPQVIDSDDPEAALAALGIGADFAFTGGGEGAEILFLHRQVANQHLYFLTNRKHRPETIEARFRVTGLQPEWWDAVSGTARPLSYRTDGQHTVIPLTLEAEDSGFVVFREPTQAPSASHPVSEPTVLLSLAERPWQVTFQPGRGAPEGPHTFNHLQSLHTLDNPGLRHFSGVSNWTTAFDVPAAALSSRLWLDLGQVGDVAEVWINGTYAGTSWFAPDRVDITRHVRAGSNRVEVRVANLWVNRLIGDVQPGAERVTFTAAPTYHPDAPLRPAGLIGPVRLLQGD